MIRPIHTYIQIQIMILSHEKDVQYFDQPIRMLILLGKTSRWSDHSIRMSITKFYMSQYCQLKMFSALKIEKLCNNKCTITSEAKSNVFGFFFTQSKTYGAAPNEKYLFKKNFDFSVCCKKSSWIQKIIIITALK